MVKIRHYGAVGPVTDEPALALFQKQWQLYRKVVQLSPTIFPGDLPVHALGREAGFGQVRELFVGPTNLFRSTVLGREASFFKERKFPHEPTSRINRPCFAAF